MAKNNYGVIGTAELKVDCYCGPTFDAHSKEWYGYFEGDMEGGYIGKELKLHECNFVPGTIITISEPICDNCNQCRSLCESSDYCNFDWYSWDENRYS